MPGSLENDSPRLPAQVYASALAAVQAGAWADALRLAGSLLVNDPLHNGALEIIGVARHALESSRARNAQRRLMTILFVDVAGSTVLVTNLGDEEYRELILMLHETAAKAVGSFGGRIAQYLGDGILAYFSYPQSYEDDAQRAIHAALELLRQLRDREPSIELRFGTAPKLRIGIDTGRVVIGAAGAGAWTTVDSIFGDPPHLAARLQSLAPPNSILISDATRSMVEQHFQVDAMGDYTVPGYSHPIAAYRVVRASDVWRIDHGGRTLFGREREMQELESTWSSVRVERARKDVLLTGEAGVGKTRLVEQLANVVVATGARIVLIQCSAVFRHSAFHAIALSLRRLMSGQQHSSTEENLRAMLAGLPPDLVTRAVPAMLSVLGESLPVDLLPEQLRTEIFEAFIGFIDQLAAAGPLLVLFEDVHTADESTSELLKALRERTRTPLMLLATARSAEFVGSWEHTLNISALDDVAARALVTSTAADLAPKVIEQVLKAASGIPLFLIDSSRAARSGDSLLGTTSVTSALLSQRLDRLDADSRELISELAVLGTSCSYPLLTSLSTLSGDRLERAAARLLSDQLLVAISDANGDSLQFRHLLYQEAAYKEQLSPARKARHARCADALGAEHARVPTNVPPELIAKHLSSADRAVESISWWKLAGDRAAATGADSEAAVLYANALEALPAIAEGSERDHLEFALQLAYGASCLVVRGYADSTTMHTFERAAEIGATMQDSEELLPTLWGIWSYYLVRSAHDRARAIADRCLALANTSKSEPLQAFAASVIGAQYVFLGSWAEARTELRLGTSATGKAALTTPQNPALASRAMLAIVEWVLGDSDTSHREINLAMTGAAALTGRQAEFTRAYVACYAAWLAQLRDEPLSALQFAQQAIDIAQRNNFSTWLSAGYLHLAGALAETGDVATALSLFEQALEGWRRAGATLMMPYFLARYARALLRAQRVEDGLRVLNQAIDSAAESGESFYDAELRRLRAEALMLSGAEADSIAEQLSAAASIAAEQRALAFELRAKTWSPQLSGPDDRAEEPS